MTIGVNDLTTLSAIKQYLRITQSNDDSLLQSLITNVSNAIQQYLNRIFAITDYTMVVNGPGYGCQVLVFENYPVTAVSSVYITGVSIPFVALNDFKTSGYRFDSNNIYLNGYEFCRGIANVQIAYSAGYASVPLSIVQAANQWIGFEYREIERIGQSAKTMNGENVSYVTDAMPKDVALILENWRQVVPSGGFGGI